jgi:hypothetical protein
MNKKPTKLRSLYLKKMFDNPLGGKGVIGPFIFKEVVELPLKK